MILTWIGPSIYFYNVLTLENEFQSDINDDGTVYTVKMLSTMPAQFCVTAWAKLRDLLMEPFILKTETLLFPLLIRMVALST